MKFGKQIKVSIISSFIATIFSILLLNDFTERVFIDTLNYLHEGNSEIDDVVIVGIDETSFQAMEMQWQY